jgi:hypothetical protein
MSEEEQTEQSHKERIESIEKKLDHLLTLFTGFIREKGPVNPSGDGEITVPDHFDAAHRWGRHLGDLCRFGKGSYNDPMETLSKLKQTGSLEGA